MNFRKPSAGVFSRLLRGEAGLWGRAWAGVFCLSGAREGVLISFLAGGAALAARPSVFAGAVLTFVFCRLFERLIGRKPELRLAINGVLLGLAVGYTFDLGLPFVALCAVAAIYAGLVSGALLWAGAVSGLPILSLPFATGFILLQIATPALGGVVGHAWNGFPPVCPEFGDALPGLLRSFFTNHGLLLFIPDPLVGAAIFLVVLARSRLLALHGLLSFVVAVVLLGSFSGNPGAALLHPSGFNFLLVGFSLGAFFLLPSWGSVAWSMLGTGLCVFFTLGLGAAFGRLGSSPSTLPFNITVILTLALLRRSGSPLIPFRHRSTPEETLDAETCSRARFGAGPELALPFAGTCRVYQAFDGPWTHKGAWRHAYDFVKCGDDGLSYRNSGLELTDYHLFGLPVLAPCAGIVVACRDDLEDNRPGRIDHVNNWGNFVILRLPSGIHVELSHLEKGSLSVKSGDTVSAGQPLGRCGNSGYSLYPHLHLQVQTGPWLGDETLPFTFAQVVYGGRLHFACLPPVGADVRMPARVATPSPLAFTLGEVLLFEYSGAGRAPVRCLWKVKRTPDVSGRFYLEDEFGDTLFFAADNSGYIALEYSGARDTALGFFALAVPRLPNLAGGARWRDAVPLALSTGIFRSEARIFARAFGVPGGRLGMPPRGLWSLDADHRRLRAHISGVPEILTTFDGKNRLLAVVSADRQLNRKFL